MNAQKFFEWYYAYGIIISSIRVNMSNLTSAICNQKCDAQRNYMKTCASFWPLVSVLRRLAFDNIAKYFHEIKTHRNGNWKLLQL